MAIHNRNDFIASLQRNPFDILNIPITASRREVNKAFDRMCFMGVLDFCAQARQDLLTPEKRLYAELGWFSELEGSELGTIRKSIEKKRPIDYKALSGFSRMNAAVFNLSLVSAENSAYFSDNILEIDRIFSHLNVQRTLQKINQIHLTAKLAGVSEYEVSSALQKKRNEICKLLNGKLESFDSKTYIGMISTLAAGAFKTVNHEGGAIIGGLVDHYELKMQPEITRKTRYVGNVLKCLRNVMDPSEVHKLLDSLKCTLDDRAPIVYPLQLKSQYTGIPDQLDEELAADIRSAAIYLSNEKNDITEAVLLLKTAKPYFENNRKLYDVFEKDMSVIQKNLQAEKEEEELAGQIKEIQDKAEEVKKEGSYAAVDRLILAMRELNNRLRDCSLPENEITIQRHLLCACCRDAAISIQNNDHLIRQAFVLMKEVYSAFSDLRDFSPKLFQDYITLRDMIPEMERSELDHYDPLHASSPKNNSSPGSTPSEQSSYGNYSTYEKAVSNKAASTQKSSSVPLVIALAIIAVLIFCAINAGYSSNYSSNGSQSSHRRDSLFEIRAGGYWDDEYTKIGNWNTYAYILNDPIENCRGLKIDFEVDMKHNTNCKDWTVYAMGYSEWTPIGEIYLPEGNGAATATLEFDKPMTIHAIIVVPNIPGSYSWQLGMEIYELK